MVRRPPARSESRLSAATRDRVERVGAKAHHDVDALTLRTRSTTRRVDPVTLQVLVSRLSGIVQEMQESVFRTGYSTIIRESHDASCMLMDANGDIVGSHAVAPLHAGSLMATARAFKAAFGDDMGPGDAYITNHPYHERRRALGRHGGQ